MQKFIAAALFAVALTGCGTAQTLTATSAAPAAIEAQAAGKAAIKKAATEAVTGEVKKLHLAVREITVSKVKLEDTALGFAQKFIATVQVNAQNPIDVEERTYEVSGLYNPTNKKSPATVTEVKLTRQTR
jgi:hypothetical protein